MYKSRNFKVDTDVRLRILEQQLKAQADELAELKVKLTSIESVQVSLPEMPGGMTPEEVIQEMYRMCGLGDDK